MRSVLVPLARWFPSRLVSDRILPWVTLGLATFGAAWTLYQYTSGVDIQRAETTLSIHRQFLDTFPDGALGFEDLTEEALFHRVLKIRCDLYAVAVVDGRLPDTLTLPVCDDVSMSDIAALDAFGDLAPQPLREEIRAQVGNIEGIEPLQARRMVTFLRSLQVCVERRQCNQDITAELFSGDIVAFLNASCSLAVKDEEFTRQGLMLGQFARSLLPDDVIPWNTDPDRKNLFLCDYLRHETT